MFEPVVYNRNRLFPRSWFRDFLNDDFFSNRLASIKADIFEEDGNLVIEAELPGFEKDEIKVQVNDNQLTISAERNQATEENAENYIRRERSVNQVCRTFIVEDLDAEKIAAKFENGLLRLTVPKPEQAQPESKEIEIN
ncbi:MAG: Hsp20/alpha crystallin family protein [Firmicutes bacterium]|nr:Hsp20/alpha crystallin family protein [Bacillota bacterium]